MIVPSPYVLLGMILFLRMATTLCLVSAIFHGNTIFLVHDWPYTGSILQVWPYDGLNKCKNEVLLRNEKVLFIKSKFLFAVF